MANKQKETRRLPSLMPIGEECTDGEGYERKGIANGSSSQTAPGGGLYEYIKSAIRYPLPHIRGNHHQGCFLNIFQKNLVVLEAL